jgi:hypothetical protein
MLLMIDNYDSFTYNLVQYFGELGEEVLTVRNDEITLEEIATLKPERICISPGPCTPHEAGVSIPVLQQFRRQIADPWRMPRSSGNWGGVWRQGDSCAASHAWQNFCDRTYLALASSRICPARTPSSAITRWRSNACVIAGLPGSDRMDRRWRNHGCAAQGFRHTRRAISP